jgi:putative ABC transport system permease protein
MWSYHFKMAYRSLTKNAMYTLLNLVGLSLGLTVSLLLYLDVRHERSFDSMHSRKDHIYRVLTHSYWDESDPRLLANAPNAVGPAAEANIAAVENSARLLPHEFGESAMIQAGTQQLAEEKLVWADPGLADIFDVTVLAGDLKAALSEPGAIALSRTAAVRYFGSDRPLGETLKVDQMPPLTVKAIYEDFPANSTLDANALASFVTMTWASQNLTWSNASFETWLLLNGAAKAADVERQLAAELDKNVPKDGQWFSLSLQPLSEVHFNSSHLENNRSSRVGDARQVWIMSLLALAILLIACFNFMNLATARAQLRFREVGVNKTVGASRGMLVRRFYVEAFVLVGAAMVLAVGLTTAAIPWFNALADRQLSFALLYTPANAVALAGIGLIAALAAGAYPALYLSSFRPKDLLLTSFRTSSGAGWVRRALVTTQFAASIALIVGTLVLQGQMRFIQQKKLGFEPEQVVGITITGADEAAQVSALAEKLRSLSEVKAVCAAQTHPGGRPSGRSIRRSANDQQGQPLQTNRAMPGIDEVLGIRLLAGRTLPHKAPGDTTVHVLLNKTAIDYLGFTPEEAVGKRVECDLGYPAIVAGVMEDFHAESLHMPVGAYAFHNYISESLRLLLVKTDTRDLPATLSRMEQAFKSSIPGSAFEYMFLDEHMASLYAREARTARVVLVFSLLSIFISCLGLFGLAAFVAERRTKEIGIRRVLGAHAIQIAGLLARDFMVLVLAALVLATPLAWYLMESWLADFAYRIQLRWWMFALAGGAALLIAFGTVSIQGVKAALADPVKALRAE